MLINEMATNSGKGAYFARPVSVDTDWQKAVRNDNAPIVRHKLAVSGGCDRQTFSLSLGYIDQEGIFDRKSTRLNSSHANISFAAFCLKKKNMIHATLSPWCPDIESYAL